jgi:hypothetical protein
MIKNRIVQLQADYVFRVIRKPAGWQPCRFDQFPSGGEVIAECYVASYAEAYDDMVRCNRLALDRDLDQWAIIQAPCGGL